MAQKPFIADMGARLGEWLITQNSDGHLAVGPVDVTTNSQRAFRADAGLKIGDWKFYEQGNHLNITPNGTSGSQRPFLVDAGLKISDWTITQNGDGNIFISTTGSVTSGLNSSTSIPTLALALDSTISGVNYEDFYGMNLQLQGTNLLSWNQNKSRAQLIDTTTQQVTLSIDHLSTFTENGRAQEVGVNSQYISLSQWDNGGPNGKVWLYDITTGNVAHILTDPADQWGWNTRMSEDYLVVVEKGSGHKLHVYDMNQQLQRTINVGVDPFYISNIENNLVAVSKASLDKRVEIWNVATGTLVNTINDPVGSTDLYDDFFGRNIHLTDTHIVFGARLGTDTSGNKDESLFGYVYEISTGNLVTTLNNDDLVTRPSGYWDRFAYHMAFAMDSTYVYAGGYRTTDETDTQDYSGILYVYEIATGDLVDTIENPNTTGAVTHDWFGRGVAVSDTKLYVGAPKEDVNTSSTGTIYVYTKY